MLPLHAPVILRSPDQQPKPNGRAEQADDGTEEEDNGHTHIMATDGHLASNTGQMFLAALRSTGTLKSTCSQT